MLNMKRAQKIALIVVPLLVLLSAGLFIFRNQLPKSSKQQYIQSQLQIAGSYIDQARINPAETKLIDNAFELCQNVLRSDPAQKDAIEMIAEIYTYKMEYQKAQELYDRLIKMEPRNMRYHVNLGFFFLTRNMKNEAFEKANLAILHDPQNSRAYFLRAIIYERDKNVSAAIADYKIAIGCAKKDPAAYRNTSIYMNLGYLYSRLGLPFDAVQQYEKIIKLWPKINEGYLALAQFYFDRGMLNKAASTLNMLVDIDKLSVRGYKGLGVVSLKKGDLKSAYAYFKKAQSFGANIDPDLMLKLEKETIYGQ